MSRASEMDQEIFKLHNSVRRKPRSLIPHLEAMLEMFEKDKHGDYTKKLRREGKSTLLTKDGVKGV